MRQGEAHLSNWGRWGEQDQRGAGNLLTAEVVCAAADLVSEGRVLSLALPLHARSLPIFAGRPAMVHSMLLDGGDYLAGTRAPDDTKSADDFVVLSLHGATHLDSLAHNWVGEELYNGVSEREIRSRGARRLGAEHLAPVFCRGVLVDCAGQLPRPPQPGEEITRAQVEAVLEAEGVELRTGDAVLVRTGWLQQWRAAKQSAELIAEEQGLAADTVDLWAANDIVVVGADNCTLEVWPHPNGEHAPLHRRMIRDYGVYLLEMLDLEELADSGRFEFLFVAAGLPVVGGTGSPVNPLAIL